MTEQIHSQSGSQNGEVLLTMTNVSKSFPGVKALDHANLSVRSHSVHALMGENGAGKSTLLKCLFGIYAKDEGEILFLGKPVNFKTSKEALENGISMVHQELNLVRQTSVMDNLWLGRYPLKGPLWITRKCTVIPKRFLMNWTLMLIQGKKSPNSPFHKCR